MFVATKPLSRTHDKAFVATKMILVAAPANDSGEPTFYMHTRYEVPGCQSLEQLQPIITPQSDLKTTNTKTGTQVKTH